MDNWWRFITAILLAATLGCSCFLGSDGLPMSFQRVICVALTILFSFSAGLWFSNIVRGE